MTSVDADARVVGLGPSRSLAERIWYSIDSQDLTAAATTEGEEE